MKPTHITFCLIAGVVALLLVAASRENIAQPTRTESERLIQALVDHIATLEQRTSENSNALGIRVFEAAIPGSVVAYAGELPTDPMDLRRWETNHGWLLCDGSSVPTNDYPALFQAIGSVYGTPSSESRFRLPDMRAMFLRGVSRDRPDEFKDPGAGIDRQNAVGSIQTNSFQKHFHGTPVNSRDLTLRPEETVFGTGAKRLPTSRYAMSAGVGDQNTTCQNSEEIGGDETRPHNIYVHYLIKY